MLLTRTRKGSDMKAKGKCVSLRLLGMQVLWIIILVSLARGHMPGDPKKLLIDSVMIAILYFPTILAFGFAVCEVGHLRRDVPTAHSLVALLLSIVIILLVAAKWYHILWLDPHGVWEKGGGDRLFR